MRRKLVYCLLGLEAALAAALCYFSASPEGALVLLAFPMEPIAMGLRALSLSGRLGNACALMLLVLFGLLPIAWGLHAWAKRGKRRADWLLLLAGPLLAYVLYRMANPFAWPLAGHAKGAAVLSAILGGAVYATLLCYSLLRLLEHLETGDMAALRRTLAPLLTLLAAAFVLSIAGEYFSELLGALRAFREANTGGHAPTEAFLILRFLIASLPEALAIRTVFLAEDMLASLDRPEAPARAEKLSRWCVRSLVVSALAELGYYILQLLLLSELRHIAGQIRFPLLGIALSIAALLFARIVSERARLAAENEQFI